ncbi:MAG: hypothetical protein JNN04_12095 [Cyclobacteriaceae bacterium]|nr:hypothetical protein [Cyclobacteriaceae bacterium]
MVFDFGLAYVRPVINGDPSGKILFATLRSLLFFLLFVRAAFGQSDSLSRHNGILQDDPSNIFTRIELFNERQTLTDGTVANVTTARGIMAIGKRFTTRVDIPYISLPRTSSAEATSGIGDVSARLLGYKILQSRRAAMLASVELSFPTAQSPLLGMGRNIITPVIAYTRYLPKRKTVLALTYQDYFSFGGDESRAHIRWSRMQLYHIRPWSRRVWTLLLPELYYDHSGGGFSMNLEATGYYRMSDRFAVWLKGGAGLFGDHPARYSWTVEVGLRHLIWRKKKL